MGFLFFGPGGVLRGGLPLRSSMPIVLEEAPAEALADAPEKLGCGVEGVTDDLGTGCGD